MTRPEIRTGEFVQTAPSVRLHLAQCGRPDAPLVLFLHGFPEFWYAWREVLPAFGRDWHAVAPDLRGFGQSSAPADPKAYRIKHLVQDIATLVSALGHRRCVLVGHDWGGALAWAVAMTHPELVERLVIINAPHPVTFARALYSDARQQQASAYMLALRAPDAEQKLAADGFAALQAFLVGHGQAAWFTDEVRQAYLRNWAQPGTLTGALNYYRASPLYPPSQDDPGTTRLVLDEAAFTLKVPTRVIWGMHDEALLPVLLEGLEALVPGVSLVRIPQASHWIVHERPGEIIDLVRDFLQPSDQIRP
jgi:epoxide hydrolase 4